MTNCSSYNKVTTANGLVINYHGGDGNLEGSHGFQGGAEGDQSVPTRGVHKKLTAN